MSMIATAVLDWPMINASPASPAQALRAYSELVDRTSDAELVAAATDVDRGVMVAECSPHDDGAGDITGADVRAFLAPVLADTGWADNVITIGGGRAIAVHVVAPDDSDSEYYDAMLVLAELGLPEVHDPALQAKFPQLNPLTPERMRGLLASAADHAEISDEDYARAIALPPRLLHTIADTIFSRHEGGFLRLYNALKDEAIDALGTVVEARFPAADGG